MKARAGQGHVFQHVYRDSKTGAWKKTRTWSIRYSVDGQARMESTGSTDRADAVRLLQQRQGEMGPKKPRQGRFRSRPYQHVLDGRKARRYQAHGLSALQNAVKTLGARAIDPTSPVGQALVAWRTELIGDLGGVESVTTQQQAVVDVAVKTKLLLDSVDAWLLAQPTLVHYKTRSLFPVVVQRQRLADGLVHYMHLLGLERRAPKQLDLAHALAARPRDQDARDSDAGDQGGTDDR